MTRQSPCWKPTDHTGWSQTLCISDSWWTWDSKVYWPTLFHKGTSDNVVGTDWTSLVPIYVRLVVQRKFTYNIHQTSSQLDDCHILFLFNMRLNERVGGVNDCNVPIFLGLENAFNRTYFVVIVGELVSSLEIYLHCLLPLANVRSLIFTSCFCFRNTSDDLHMSDHACA